MMRLAMMMLLLLLLLQANGEYDANNFTHFLARFPDIPCFEGVFFYFPALAYEEASGGKHLWWIRCCAMQILDASSASASWCVQRLMARGKTPFGYM
uniref:Putative secreted peptide n=1 Tax=Anopheles braziliensis TaxID=58242 RepID=A0A2M3ZRG8_9DIPT